MKIGLSVTFPGEKGGGPETYERCLVKGLADVDKDNEYHVYGFSDRAIDAIRVPNENFVFHRLRPAARWISLPLSLPLKLVFDKVEAYHATFVPALYATIPCIFTMHDVTPFTHPEYYPPDIRSRLVPLIRRGIRSAERIVCISEHCRNTTQELFGVHDDRLDVVHHGVDPSVKPVSRPKAMAILAEKFPHIRNPFILYLGKLDARKNVIGLIEAYARLKREYSGVVDLVLAGRRHGEGRAIDEAISRLGLQASVIELGYVDDVERSALYCGAEIFAFPSFWEGFGLPILEAMVCGTPVVTSNVSCLPEVAGDAAILVDPARAEDIAAGMYKLLTDDSLRQQLVKAGYKRAASFNWESTARQTIESYRKAVS